MGAHNYVLDRRRGNGKGQPRRKLYDASSLIDMSASITVVGLFLTAVLVPSTNGHMVEPCVATFYEFEKATVKESPGNVQALVAAFYEANRPVPLSVQVVYHVTSNGTDTVLSTNPDCPSGDELWLWLPSPVFMFVEPTKLNLCALYTLNYFRHWTPRRAHIHVPYICNQTHRRFNFYNDLTSRVCTYEVSTHIGNILS